MIKTLDTVDLTPTWEAIAPLLAVALADGSPSVKEFALEEIKRMARLADFAVPILRAQETALVPGRTFFWNGVEFVR